MSVILTSDSNTLPFNLLPHSKTLLLNKNVSVIYTDEKFHCARNWFTWGSETQQILTSLTSILNFMKNWKQQKVFHYVLKNIWNKQFGKQTYGFHKQPHLFSGQLYQADLSALNRRLQRFHANVYPPLSHLCHAGRPFLCLILSAVLKWQAF